MDAPIFAANYGAVRIFDWLDNRLHQVVANFGESLTFGTWGPEVQILSLRPYLSP
jgi:hypothetical protein